MPKLVYFRLGNNPTRGPTQTFLLSISDLPGFLLDSCPITGVKFHKNKADKLGKVILYKCSPRLCLYNIQLQSTIGHYRTKLIIDIIIFG